MNDGNNPKHESIAKPIERLSPFSLASIAGARARSAIKIGIAGPKINIIKPMMTHPVMRSAGFAASILVLEISAGN